MTNQDKQPKFFHPVQVGAVYTNPRGGRLVEVRHIEVIWDGDAQDFEARVHVIDDGQAGSMSLNKFCRMIKNGALVRV